MNGTTLTSGNYTEDLLADLLSIEKTLGQLKSKILTAAKLKYGSDEWWEKETESAIASIKAGKGKKFKTYEEAVRYLHS